MVEQLALNQFVVGPIPTALTKRLSERSEISRLGRNRSEATNCHQIVCKNPEGILPYDLPPTMKNTKPKIQIDFEECITNTIKKRSKQK